MAYILGCLTCLMIHWGLFELSCENWRFNSPILPFFALKSVTFWPRKWVILQAIAISHNIFRGHCRAPMGKSRKGCDRRRTTDARRHVPGVKQHNREIVATKKTGVSLITRPPIKMTPERKLCTISSLIKVIFLPWRYDYNSMPTLILALPL